MAWKLAVIIAVKIAIVLVFAVDAHAMTQEEPVLKNTHVSARLNTPLLTTKYARKLLKGFNNEVEVDIPEPCDGKPCKDEDDIEEVCKPDCKCLPPKNSEATNIDNNDNDNGNTNMVCQLQVVAPETDCNDNKDNLDIGDLNQEFSDLAQSANDGCNQQ